MTTVLPDTIAGLVRAVGPAADAVIEEMDDRAAESGFPTVGPEVGGALAWIARVVDARRVFEFGSGFGYSAYWFARALPEDGQVVLTDRDEQNLNDAREYLARGGVADLATFERRDAVEAIADYEGPFDVVLLDHEKERYTEGFEAAREYVPAGGVVVADNAITAGSIDPEALLGLLGADSRDHPGEGQVSDATTGIAEYLATVRADPDFETVLLPLGEGIAVSYRTDE